jgi:hypothetical protein
MKKKRSRGQARLEDYGIDIAERKQTREQVTDYQWMLQNFAGRPKDKKEVKTKRKKKQMMLAETRKKVIELRFGVYKEIYDPETAVIKHKVKNISLMVLSNYK